MRRLLSVVSISVGLCAYQLHAQEAPPIKRIELALDVGWQANSGNSIQRASSTPVGFRYGAVTTGHRFLLDQRFMLMNRLKGSPGTFLIDTQLGWRLGSTSRIRSSVFGPYAFTSFHFTGAHRYHQDATTAGPLLFGFAGGVGTRIALFQIVVRPELVFSHDLSSGTRDDQYWVPSRNSIGVRLGYGFHLPVGDKKKSDCAC